MGCRQRLVPFVEQAYPLGDTHDNIRHCLVALFTVGFEIGWVLPLGHKVLLSFFGNGVIGLHAEKGHVLGLTDRILTYN